MDTALTSAKQHHTAGRLELAARQYRLIIDADATNAEARHLLGVLLLQQNDSAGAAHWIGEAVRLSPASFSIQSDFGLALQATGDFAAAENCYRSALELNPDFPEAHYNMGNVLLKLDRLKDAADSYTRAVTLAPALFEAHHNLGNVQRRLSRLTDAVDSFTRGAALRGDLAITHTALAEVLMLLGRVKEAVAAYRQALALDPRNARTLTNLGNAFAELKLDSAAIAAFEQAVTLAPDYAPAHFGLGLVRQTQGWLRNAIDCYDRVLVLQPDHVEAANQQLNASLHLCDWSRLDAQAQCLKDFIAAEKVGLDPYFLVFVPGISAAEQRRAAETYARHRFAWERHQPAPLPEESTPSSRKLRIGYLSADFHEHATAYLLAEVIELHDRSQFKILAYSLGPDDESTMRARLRSAFDCFIEIRGMSFQAAAERIRGDQVDILIDLKGYTGLASPEIPALRPTPIQISFLGYPGTMGADFIDYLISDRNVCPPGSEAHYTERLAYLDCCQPNDQQRWIASETPTRASCGLPEGSFVFCAFNGLYKITPPIFDIWMRLLRDTPDAVLWFLEGNAEAAANLRREAAARGIAPERLIFAPRIKLADHLARHVHADLLLDTSPCSAHTTASDALWAGLPVLTCMGNTFASRIAGSLVRSANLPELAVDTLEEYERLARLYSTDRAALATLRARLREAKMTSTLFNSRHFTRQLEGLYQQMWARYSAGPPSSLLSA